MSIAAIAPYMGTIQAPIIDPFYGLGATVQAPILGASISAPIIPSYSYPMGYGSYMPPVSSLEPAASRRLDSTQPCVFLS